MSGSRLAINNEFRTEKLVADDVNEVFDDPHYYSVAPSGAEYALRANSAKDFVSIVSSNLTMARAWYEQSLSTTTTACRDTVLTCSMALAAGILDVYGELPLRA